MTVFTRILGASSRARHWVMIMRPALDAQVLTPLRRPLIPVDAPMFTMTPPSSWVSICLAACWEHKNAPLRFTSTTRSQSCFGHVQRGLVNDACGVVDQDIETAERPTAWWTSAAAPSAVPMSALTSKASGSASRHRLSAAAARLSSLRSSASPHSQSGPAAAQWPGRFHWCCR